MRIARLITAMSALGVLSLSGSAAHGERTPQTGTKPVLYVTATAHLDTQWLWTIQTTIDEYLPATLRDNFALFEKYPDYTFSFEGAFRYMLAKEYYPEDYARLSDYIAQGRWCVCGSSIVAGDVNVPAPESLIRQVLYGNDFFEREFGRRSCDIYLPDCFGFGYALPSVAAHCGLKGFSTQKLTWGSSVGIPFNVGVWEGIDGSSILAAINPGEYVAKVRSDLSVDEEWLARINKNGEQSGAFVDYKYFGVGDRGGAPDEESVQWIEKAIAGDGPIRVVNLPADRIFHDLTADQIDRLPRYDGELLMTRHGIGCYTSQCAMKRWNRKNELLADAAERAAVAADWLGGLAYPRQRLTEAWIRFLWHQFHDDLTGTSIPHAYQFSWNDEIIALNQFAAVLTDSVGTIARALDTRVKGIPVIVFNPLAFEREDVVRATVRFPNGAPAFVDVYDTNGRRIPSQVLLVEDRNVEMLFRARVPSVGFAVFDVRPAQPSLPAPATEPVTATKFGLENGRYRVSLNPDGDVAGIYDKKLGRELLLGPARLQFLQDTPAQWSEWEIDLDDISAEPYAHAAGPAQISVIEEGPIRAAVKVARRIAGSTVIQRISLASGRAGDHIEFDTVIDWQTPKTLLKASFPLGASNLNATYDLGFGAIERPNNSEKKYEVPAQQWADITASDGSFGVTIANDCKYGWDKPADNLLRLTLIHSPNDVEKDMGRHRVLYSIAGHAADWRAGNAIRQAARINQPLMAFQTSPHRGSLESSFSLLSVDSPQVVVRAIKKAEHGEEVIIRVQEAHGKSARNVAVSMATPILAAREVNGAEQLRGDFAVQQGRLRLDFEPFQPRTLAVTLTPPDAVVPPPAAQPVILPYDRDVVSSDRDRADGDFDGAGHSLPAELLPATIHHGGIQFAMGPTATGKKNAVTCRGQSIALPDGDYDRLYVLASAQNGPAAGEFAVGSEVEEIVVADFTSWVGQSDSLIVDGKEVEAARMAPAFIHRDEIAWVGTHRHDGPTDRNEPYVFCYLFQYGIDLPAGAKSVTLPDNDRIRIMAMTVADNPNDDTEPAQYLYDHVDAVFIDPPGGLHIDPVSVDLSTDARGADVVFTLDGSEPTAKSVRFTTPIRLTKTTTIAARTLRNGRLGDFVRHATFVFAEPRPPEPVQDLRPGLCYRYYEGEWKQVSGFETATPVKFGTVDTFDVSPRQTDERYGFTIEGLVRVPSEAVYTFCTASDDGSTLSIGGELVVDNDGLHGERERCGVIALQPGLHPIRVDYFELTGDDVLHVRYFAPGIAKQPIPAEVLFHAAPIGE